MLVVREVIWGKERSQRNIPKQGVGAPATVCRLVRLHQMAQCSVVLGVPSRKLTYPTLGKGTSSSKVPFVRDMLVPRRVAFENQTVIPIFETMEAHLWQVGCKWHKKSPCPNTSCLAKHVKLCWVPFKDGCYSEVKMLQSSWTCLQLLDSTGKSKP